ncbi:MAG: AMP-binding protein [Thermodesulfobacteriota bacterium]
MTLPQSTTLVEALETAVREFADGWFARSVREDGSFQDMDRRAFLVMALRVAAWCRDKGLPPGGRAVICLENSPAWGAVYFGVLLAGGVAVPVDAQSVPSDAAYYLQKSRASVVFTYRRDIFPAGLPEGCVLTVGTKEALSSAPLSLAEAHRPQPGNLAALIFTSGTTGRPKAVMLTHANLLANVKAVWGTGLLTRRDNFLAVLPLHHAYPCMVNLLVPLLTGARTTFVETLKPDAILSALKTAEVSILVLTPQYVGVFHRRILKKIEDMPIGLGRLAVRLLTVTAGRRPDRLAFLRRAIRRGIGPNFRYFLTGGARCEPEVIQGMAALGIPVIEGYGLSETAPVVSFNHPETGVPGSVGAPLEGVEARLDRPDQDGYGELLVRGPSVMPGYFEDPEATAKALGGGWLRTGDQARMDEAGRIFIRGRERDIIVLPSGKKFPAEEVETHYRQAPSVAEICVLQAPGGSLKAVVVPDMEFFRKTDSPDIRHNIRWDLEVLSRGLPPYKRVGNFTVVTAELPKTRLGKIKRHLVEKMLETGETGPDEPESWPELDESGRKAVEAVARASGVERFGPGAHLELDLGLDSLKRLELITLLEDALGRAVPEERFQRLATAREVADLAVELAGGAPTAEPGNGSGQGLLAELPENLAEKVRLEFGTFDKLATDALWGVIAGAARLGFGLEVRGGENIPDGPAIITPNHASFLDGFMVFAGVPRRHRMRLYFLGLARFFDSAMVKRLAARFRLISVDAGRISETMRLSARVLRSGGLLCVFPEGARTPTGELQKFRRGPVTLSKELGVPVVPVAITGTFEAWPVGGKLKRHKVTLTFGRPMIPDSPEKMREAVEDLLAGASGKQ